MIQPLWIDDRGIPHITPRLPVEIPIPLWYRVQRIPICFPVPTGSIMFADSKFGHEVIAGTIFGGQQIVIHKEPGVGMHIETVPPQLEMERAFNR
jgi:hypothetical protein